MGMAKKPAKDTFEGSLAKLEELVERLEEGGMSLEESLNVFEEGKKLEKMCQELLDKAQKRVDILMKEGGSVKAEPFDPNGDG